MRQDLNYQAKNIEKEAKIIFENEIENNRIVDAPSVVNLHTIDESGLSILKNISCFI